MDERSFTKFLKGKKLADETVRHYVISVRQFEKWLFDERQRKSLETASERDINNWAPSARGPDYLQGVKQYYLFQRNPEMVKEIEKILSKMPTNRRAPRLIDWTEFKNLMTKAEENGIKDRDRALLNLLWSEMPHKEILELYISDLDFEKLIVTHYSGKKYYLTKEAWDALLKYIYVEDRGKRKRLFPMSTRLLLLITKKHFDSVKQTPHTLLLSCRKDLVDAGRRTRFVTEPEQRPSPKIEPEQKMEIIRKDLFEKFVQEIKNFGNRMHERMEQIKDEKEFKRLLEGYLLATLPDEIIIPEFHFKGYDSADSIIDFAIGRDPKIPIEVKIAEKKIRDHIGKGSGQVKEFLKSYGSSKGILVVGDKERNPERRKHIGMQDNVYIIVI